MLVFFADLLNLLQNNITASDGYAICSQVLTSSGVRLLLVYRYGRLSSAAECDQRGPVFDGLKSIFWCVPLAWPWISGGSTNFCHESTSCRHLTSGSSRGVRLGNPNSLLLHGPYAGSVLSVLAKSTIVKCACLLLHYDLCLQSWRRFWGRWWCRP